MTPDTKTGGAGELRAAADCLDDARTDLKYGDLDLPAEEIEAIAERIDAQVAELETTLRELAAIAEVNGLEGDDV